MKIEGNQKELDAMAEFHKGNRAEGLRLQEEFAAEFREEYKEKDGERGTGVEKLPIAARRDGSCL